jgi:hypothetical protein
MGKSVLDMVYSRKSLVPVTGLSTDVALRSGFGDGTFG